MSLMPGSFHCFIIENFTGLIASIISKVCCHAEIAMLLLTFILLCLFLEGKFFVNFSLILFQYTF